MFRIHTRFAEDDRWNLSPGRSAGWERAARHLAQVQVELMALDLDGGGGVLLGGGRVPLPLSGPGGAGLPGWTAAVARGEPAPMDLPEEVIEDLLQLGREVLLPQVRAPRVKVMSTSNLTARNADNFRIRCCLVDPDRGGDALRIGSSRWMDAAGGEWLLPTTVAMALDRVLAGPPQPRRDQTLEEATRDRMLWWARTRALLLSGGAELDPYLRGQEVIEVDRIRPRLVPTPDGQADVLISAPGLTEAELTKVADDINPRNPRDYTLRRTDAQGRTRHVRVIPTARGRRALARAHQLRRHRRSYAAQLADAPESLFDPECFDLSEYGDRVFGVGAVVYRVSRFVPPDSAAGGPAVSRLRLTPGGAGDDDEDLLAALSLVERQDLAARLSQAAKKGIPYIEFKGRWIRVPAPATAEEMEVQAHGGTKPARGRLLVYLNLEGEEYTVEDRGDGVVVGLPARPPGLAPDVELFPHQQIGIGWLAGHAGICDEASNHGLLADDMGLGKTLQVLALMSLLKAMQRLSPCLLVAPASLLANWEEEADRYFPGVFVDRVVLGPGVVVDADTCKTRDWMLTSYETLRSRQLELGRVRWGLMVLDESHRIRNPTAQTTHAILAMDAERRLALSGTPVQNSLIDLWSQFDWLVAGYLGELGAFRRIYEKQRHSIPKGRSALDALKEKVAPRMLRRTKRAELAGSLPSLEIHRIEIPFGAAQEALYDAILQDGRRKGEGAALGALHHLLKVGAHPQALGLDDGQGNPKLDWLARTLSAIRRKGEKALIFAEWYDVQDLLVDACQERFGCPVDRINGLVEAGLRLRKVKRFNASPGFGMMVLGPKAAGVGLNIIGANHVIHYTRHWNPASEVQATDRVYRIGQSRPVQVYLPVMTHSRVRSIEAHLDALLSAKEALARDVIVPTDALNIGVELQEAVFFDGEAR